MADLLTRVGPARECLSADVAATNGLAPAGLVADELLLAQTPFRCQVRAFRAGFGVEMAVMWDDGVDATLLP